MPRDEVLTLKEVAALPKIADKIALTTGRRSMLRGFEADGQWRFTSSELDGRIGNPKSSALGKGEK